jgi:hypothetical protein
VCRSSPDSTLPSDLYVWPARKNEQNQWIVTEQKVNNGILSSTGRGFFANSSGSTQAIVYTPQRTSPGTAVPQNLDLRFPSTNGQKTDQPRDEFKPLLNFFNNLFSPKELALENK